MGTITSCLRDAEASSDERRSRRDALAAEEREARARELELRTRRANELAEEAKLNARLQELGTKPVSPSASFAQEAFFEVFRPSSDDEEEDNAPARNPLPPKRKPVAANGSGRLPRPAVKRSGSMADDIEAILSGRQP